MWGKKMQNSWADNQREHYGKLAGAVRRLLCSFIVLKPEKIIVLLLFFPAPWFFFCLLVEGWIYVSPLPCVLTNIISPCNVYHNLFILNSNRTSKMASINVWYFKATSNKGCYYPAFFSLFIFFLLFFFFLMEELWGIRSRKQWDSRTKGLHSCGQTKWIDLEKVTSITFVPEPPTATSLQINQNAVIFCFPVLTTTLSTHFTSYFSLKWNIITCKLADSTAGIIRNHLVAFVTTDSQREIFQLKDI